MPSLMKVPSIPRSDAFDDLIKSPAVPQGGRKLSEPGASPRLDANQLNSQFQHLHPLQSLQQQQQHPPQHVTPSRSRALSQPDSAHRHATLPAKLSPQQLQQGEPSYASLPNPDASPVKRTVPIASLFASSPSTPPQQQQQQQQQHIRDDELAFPPVVVSQPSRGNSPPPVIPPKAASATAVGERSHLPRKKSVPMASIVSEGELRRSPEGVIPTALHKSPEGNNNNNTIGGEGSREARPAIPRKNSSASASSAPAVAAGWTPQFPPVSQGEPGDGEPGEGEPSSVPPAVMAPVPSPKRHTPQPPPARSGSAHVSPIASPRSLIGVEPPSPSSASVNSVSVSAGPGEAPPSYAAAVQVPVAPTAIAKKVSNVFVPALLSPAELQALRDQNLPGPESEDEEKRAKRLEMLTLIRAELIDTERTYVHSLTDLFEKYIRPLNLNPDKYQITAQEILGIFANIMSLKGLHEAMLIEFESVFQRSDSIADVFIKYAPFLRMYTGYVNNYEKTCSTLNVSRHNSKFQQFMEKTRAEDARGMTIMSYLILPIQRIGRYVMLLERMLGKSKPWEADYVKLLQAIKLAKKIGDHVNESKRHMENMSALLDVQNRLRGNDKFVVMSPDRKFVREGVVFKSKGNSKDALKNYRQMTHRCALFSDKMLIMTPEFVFIAAIDLVTLEALPDKSALSSIIKDESELEQYNTLLLIKETQVSKGFGSLLKGKDNSAWSWALGFETVQMRDSWAKDITATIESARDLAARRMTITQRTL